MYAVFSTDNTNVQLGARGEMISDLMPANYSICKPSGTTCRRISQSWRYTKDILIRRRRISWYGNKVM